MNGSYAAQKTFDPWSVPESVTMFNFAPEDIRSFMHPHWQTQKAVHPVWFYALGLYFLIIGKLNFFVMNHSTRNSLHKPKIYLAGTIAFGGNISVLRIFGRCPSLRTPSNMLVMNLAVSDLMLMITLMPELLYNFFNGGPWRFGDIACQIHAFCGNLLALVPM
jgi:r-opsin